MSKLSSKIRTGWGLSSSNESMISSNCFADRIMQDIGMEYNSPTLGLYFMYPDYIEFLRTLNNVNSTKIK